MHGHLHRGSRLEAKNVILCQQVQDLHAAFTAERLLCEHAEAQYVAAEAHCTLRAHETNHLYEQLNSKSQKKTRRKAHPHAHLLTAPEAWAAFEAKEQERITRDDAAAQKQAAKVAEEHQ